MWIETTEFTSNGDPIPRKRNHPALSEPVEFKDTGRAQVTDADGQFLIDEYDAIQASAGEAGDDDGGDGSDESTDDAAEVDDASWDVVGDDESDAEAEAESADD